MKICYLGNDFFYQCLVSLIECSHSVIQVITNHTDDMFIFNDQIKHISSSNRIPLFEGKADKSQIEELFYKKNCDLFISAGYAHLIPVLDDPGFKAVNIHPSLLPVGRGPWPLPYFILKQMTHGGVTIHKLAEEYDTGDILLQKSFIIEKDACVEMLTHRAHILAAKMVTELIGSLDRLWDNAKKQDGSGEWWKMPNIKDRTIKAGMDIQQILRIVRAFGHYGSYMFLDSNLVFVKNATGWEDDGELEPGKVVYRSPHELVITVKNGYFCITDYVVK